MMRIFHHSCLLILLLAVSTCLFHDGAAAGAFAPSASARRIMSSRPSMKRGTAPSSELQTSQDLNSSVYQRSVTNNTALQSRRRHHLSHMMILRLAGGGGKDGDSSSSFWNKQLSREMLAELLGTFLIVQLGAASVMAAIFDNALVGLFQIAAVWAIAVTLAISTTASVSGAHLNPAISMALALFRPTKSFGWAKVLPYCLAQLAGGILGSWVNFIMYASKISKYESVNGIVRGTTGSIASAKAFGEYFLAPITWRTALFAEAFGTAILAFVVFSLTNPRNNTMKKSEGFVPPLIGATVGALVCGIAPLTQAGFNPARDFGPRIVAAMAGWGRTVAFQGWWVYVVGPMIGAPIGAYVADKLLLPDEDAA